MSKSTHAHIRYNILDYCFRKKSLTFDELLEYVNIRLEDKYPGEKISVRTLREDIKLFRDKDGFNAPLPENKRKYYYSDRDFSIAQRPLLEYEQYLLDATQELLSRFENHPKYDKLAEALIKFQEEEEQTGERENILYYDHNDEYKGIQFLKPLYLAIQRKKVLCVIYQGFKDKKPSEYIFHPYVLKQYNRRWFVFGKHEERDITTWSIPLDERLLDFTEIEEVNYAENTTDWDTFFRSQVGVTRPNDYKIVRVVLRFYNGREHYFKTKPFQPDFEEFFEEEKQNQIWFDTIINKELVQQLLSFGKDLEVLEPPVLRQIIRKEVEEMMRNYISMQ